MKKVRDPIQLIRNLRYRERKRDLRRLRVTRRSRSQSPLKSSVCTLPDAIRAPGRFFLHNSEWHEEFVLFLGSVRDAFVRGSGAITIDFSQTRELMPGATLLFYAELDRLVQIFPDAQLKFVKSRSDTVNQVMEHLGVYAKAGFRSGASPERDDVVNWRVVSSSSSDGKVAGSMIEAYESLTAENSKRLFRGVSEAIPNAVEHAYIDVRGDGIPCPQEKRWWMFCRESEHRFYVGVCDLGVGIPGSLPKTFPELFLSIFPGALLPALAKSDAAMIRAAMEISRTRTKLHERGKGLGDIRSVVDQIKGSELYVFSNRGLVEYSSGEYKQTTFARSIMGTIVVWIVPVQEVAHHA